MPLTLDNLDSVSLCSTVSTPPSPGSPGSPSHGELHRLDRKSSVRPYQSKDAYLYAMREDLAVWFNDLYNTQLTADNLLDSLRDGTFLCLHANNVKSYIDASGSGAVVPDIVFRSGAKAESFQARDNLANFITWVKVHLGVNEVLLFESDDLVLNKNEKNVVLCLLEVARRGARYGMLAPMLIQFEQEIDALEQKIKRAEGRRSSQGSMTDVGAAHSDTDSDKASLDEWVQSVVHRCTCPKQFPLINVSRGKYRIGYTQNVVFVRILRNHVMIRVGGGWDTLEHYLDKHDPCRCHRPRNAGPKQKVRHRTSTGKAATLSRDKSPSMPSRTRSQSFTSLESPDIEQVPPPKPRKSGSSDLLCSDLVITRTDSGQHVIDENANNTSPLTKSPSRKQLKTSSRYSPQSNLRVSSGPERRSSSPSHDLMRKWRDNVTNQSPHQSSKQTMRERSSSGTRRHHRSGSTDRQPSHTSNSRTPRNRSISNLTKGDRTRSHSRGSSDSKSTHTQRSRSYSRPSTPTLTDSDHVTRTRRITVASIHASPRKDRRHSHGTPTRIPAPTASLPTRNGDSGAMISSTSTCNSMDSFMTV